MHVWLFNIYKQFFLEWNLKEIFMHEKISKNKCTFKLIFVISIKIYKIFEK